VWVNGDDAVPRGLAVASAIILRLIVVVGGLYLLGIAAGKLLVVVLPLVVALLLATLLAPPARRLERRGWPPGLAAALMTLGATCFLLGLLAVVIPSFIAQAPDLRDRVQDGTRELASLLSPLGLAADDVNGMIDSALADLESNRGRIAGGVVTASLLVTQWAAAILLCLVLCFFFVKDGRRLWSWTLDLCGEGKRDEVEAIGRRSWEVLSSYVRGVAFVALVDAVLIGAGLLALGVPLAVPLTVLTYLAAFFPIVGAVLAGAAAMLVALVTNGIPTALAIGALILVVQQLEGNFLYPVVVGKRLSLHPVAILIALGAGGVLGGIAGAFLSVPVAAVGAAILELSRERRVAERTVLLPSDVPEPESEPELVSPGRG